QGCNLAISLDLKLQLGAISFTTNSAEIALVVADNKGKTIDTINAAGSSMVPYPNAGTSNFKAAWDQVLAKLNASLDTSETLGKYVSGLPKPTAAAASTEQPPPSLAAIDLAFWDSIKGS